MCWGLRTLTFIPEKVGKSVAILGAALWASSLACYLAQSGRAVTIIE
jgi:pyruvate/2-oxoglutarate dehydrogenase complex dihydrolipoamide dehydrogenase (E3) component